MLNKIRENKWIIIIVLFIIIMISILWLYITDKTVTINKLQKEVNTKSDIEILTADLLSTREHKQNMVKNIDNLKNTIKVVEEDLRLTRLKDRCLEAQVNRLLSSVEYNINYCEKKENLEQFSKKY